MSKSERSSIVVAQSGSIIFPTYCSISKPHESNAINGVENRAQISHFLTPWKIYGRSGPNVWVN